MIKIWRFQLMKCVWKCRLQNGVHFITCYSWRLLILDLNLRSLSESIYRTRVLTHWGWGKMAAMEQTILPNSFLFVYFYSDSNLLKAFLACLVNHKPASLQMITWHWIGSKSLSDLMIAYFTDAHMLQIRQFKSDTLGFMHRYRQFTRNSLI